MELRSDFEKVSTMCFAPGKMAVQEDREYFGFGAKFKCIWRSELNSTRRELSYPLIDAAQSGGVLRFRLRVACFACPGTGAMSMNVHFCLFLSMSAER